MSERILDIGIGSGGTYINHDRKDTKRFGLDTQLDFLQGLVDYQPAVLPTVGSAEHLPFADSSFNRVQIILPERELALPGLQIEHPKINQKYTDEFRKTCPDGWYSELARVLNPQGSLILIGELLHLPSVKTTSYNFFTIQDVRPFPFDEFKNLGTPKARALLEVYFYAYTREERRQFSEGLVEIKMVNKKI